MVMPGLDEALYREAEERRSRQQRREEEALAAQRSRPRLSRASRRLCKGRLERELQEAFVRAGCPGPGPGRGEGLRVPRDRLSCVLEALGLLAGGAGEEAFCEQLGLLLDRGETGCVAFEGLLGFLVRARERRAGPPPESLEEECFGHLEQQLARDFGRLLANRLCRPRASSPRPGAGSGAQRGPALARQAASAPGTPRACTPRSARAAPPGVAQPWGRGADPGRSASSAPAERASARCQLLYQQALFASREGAQLEEEIRLLREREAMRECTFRPKLCSQRRPSQCAQPRNFELAVSRMRSGQRQREEQQEALSRIPRGDNYARLRRLGQQPFSCYFRGKSNVGERGPPLFLVEVEVGRGRVGRIGVYEGDDLRQKARSFARAFQLDHRAALRLEGMLQKACEERLQADEARYDPASEHGSSPRSLSQRLHEAGTDLEAREARVALMPPRFHEETCDWVAQRQVPHAQNQRRARSGWEGASPRDSDFRSVSPASGTGRSSTLGLREGSDSLVAASEVTVEARWSASGASAAGRVRGHTAASPVEDPVPSPSGTSEEGGGGSDMRSSGASALAPESATICAWGAEASTSEQ